MAESEFRIEVERIQAHYRGMLEGVKSGLAALPIEEAEKEIKSREAEAIYALKERYDAASRVAKHDAVERR